MTRFEVLSLMFEVIRDFVKDKTSTDNREQILHRSDFCSNIARK